MANDIDTTSVTCHKVLDEVERAIVGKRSLLEDILAAVLAGGHVLLEDYPGLGKTLISKSFARALGIEFKRIQFTPDLLPGDITGSYIFNRSEGRFEIRKGPLFGNLVLADEINRASPKTQSSLLEAMQEYQVTIEGDTFRLPDPFVVLATQNPIEFEGTFPLPEAQLDRFIMKVAVGYPTLVQEREILRRRLERRTEEVQLGQVTQGSEVLAMRAAVELVDVHPDIEEYIAVLVHETRRDRRVAIGASPRGSLALLRLGRARAALEGRAYVVPDDVKRFVVAALCHRLILQPEYWMKRGASEDVIEEILGRVEVPVISEDRM